LILAASQEATGILAVFLLDKKFRKPDYCLQKTLFVDAPDLPVQERQIPKAG
jgi:hypothetical protein